MLAIAASAVSRRFRVLASAAALAALATPAFSATTATWLAPVSGNWTDPTKWSTNPIYPNNGSPTPADTYDVLIAQLGSAYNIDIDAPIAIDSLTLNSPNATLRNSSTFTLQNLTINSGQLRLLANSTIADATITAPDGAMPIIATGVPVILRNVALGADLTIDGSAGNAFLINDSPRPMAGATISFAAALGNAVLRTHSLSGTGELVFNGTSNSNAIGAFAGVPLTIGPGIVVRTGTSGGGVGTTDTIINEGLFSAQTPGMTLGMSGVSVANRGTVEAKNGGTLRIVNLSGPLGNHVLNGGTLEFDGATNLLDPLNITAGNALTLRGSWTNSGGININGGQINFGTIPAALGTITHNDATIGVVGALTTTQLETIPYTAFSKLAIGPGANLDNTGKSLQLPASGATFSGGVIKGGTIEGPAGTSLVLRPPNPGTFNTLEGVTLNVDSSGSIFFRDGITLNKIHTGSVSAPLLGIGSAETISGSGQIILNNGRIENARNRDITISSGITIRTSSGSGDIGRVGTSGRVINNGTMIADGGSFNFLIPTTNAGSITIHQRSSARIDGNFINTGTITNNGWLTIDGFFGPFSSTGTIGGSGLIDVWGDTTISGSQKWLATALLAAHQHTTRLNSNAGEPATPQQAASANLSIIIEYGDNPTVSLDADQDLYSAKVNAWNDLNQSLDLNSPTSPGGYRSLRVYDDQVVLARNSLYYAIVNANAPGSTTPTDGIFDSNLASHPNSRIGLAQVLDAHGDPHLLVRPTRIGDVNLDGAVTIADFAILSSNFNRTNAYWDEGDINYDRAVTIADFIDLAANFNTTYSGEAFPISNDHATILADFAAAHVPEPGQLVSMLAGTLLVRLRRR